MMGDPLSLAIKIISATIQALVCGSLFYDLPKTSESLFLRPGALFFPVFYFLMEAMSETTVSFMGRPILARQKRFGFYRPTAFCIANALTDIPVVMIQVTVFSLIIYFMTNLQLDAAKFFTFWIVVNINCLAFIQLFRMVGALCGKFGTASQLTSLLSTVFFVYGGYLIPFESMHPWFRWIFYLNPAAYAFESLMANEFTGLELDCVTPQYVPYGGQYESEAFARHRGCTVPGSSDVTGVIDGHAYIAQQYAYATGHIWRGFGVLVGFWVAFIAVTAVGFELRSDNGGSSVLLYKRSLRNKKVEGDVEAAKEEKGLPAASRALGPPQSAKQSTFCWHDLDYFVKYQGQQKQLLDKVFGFVQPGNLVALMGCSGAGKTT
jgi:ABC-type multidrug transport system permease subunit